ncbi:MAG: cation:dicarboxylase symporter family transporter [Burkholderiales bacterium]|nr:cation:dicarboxylase symporter family transporter [Burkholderiales bacterium]
MIKQNKRWYFKLWVWVLIFILFGMLFGLLEPQYVKSTKPIIDGFIHLIKLLVGPIIFFTVLSGVIGMGSLKQLGSIGLKSFIYFEVVSSIGLLIGLGFAYLFHPGANLNLSVSMIDPSLVNNYINQSHSMTGFIHILKMIVPTNLLTPFLTGNTLQVLFMAILLGFLLFYITKAWQDKFLNILHKIQDILFKILACVMWLSPLASFASMAFMVGTFGYYIILNMLLLVLTMIFACTFLIVVVLGIIARLAGFNIFKFINHIKDEIILVFATSSSESALGPIMNKLKKSGVHESVVGIVIPAGYSFNLDGTNIYLALTIGFLCQAFNIHLSWQEYLTLLLILMLTSKGAAGVTGSGFIVLAGTLSALHGNIPVATIAILLGIDKIMSELRSTTNLVGNSLAAVVVAIMDKKLDRNKFNSSLAYKVHVEM